MLTVRYRADEKAHGVLYVDRRQSVYSKFARTADRLRFFGKVDGKPLAVGPHRSRSRSRTLPATARRRSGSGR